MPIVTFQPGPAIQYGEQAVYTRTNWVNAWAQYTTLHCLEATWGSGPTLSSATFCRDYGVILQPGQVVFSKRAKDLTLGRNFVKVRFPMDRDAAGQWNYRYWYGVIDLVEDSQGGAVTVGQFANLSSTATGKQYFTAYGLEKLLADHPLQKSWILHAGATQEISRALTFNRNGRPNRTAAVTGLGTYAFEGDVTTASYWSTLDIVAYLLKNYTPRDEAGILDVEFIRVGMSLPDWDRPVIDQERHSIWSIFNELMNRSRIISWRINSVDEVPAPDQIKIEAFSLTPTQITLPLDGAPVIAANTRTRPLEYDGDPSTAGTIKDSGVAQYDQVIYRGARKRSVGSYSFDDSTLVISWESGDQSTYGSAASGVTGYAALDDQQKSQRNAEARSTPKLNKIYSFFQIAKTWDGKVKNGEAGAANPLFADGSASGKPFYWGELFCEPSLPLLETEDYSLARVADGLVKDYAISGIVEQLAPFAVFLVPGSSPIRWIAGDKMGLAGLVESINDTDNNTFSVEVHVPGETQGCYVKVQGGPQHSIAKTDFTPLAADEEYGDFHFRKMILTLSFQWDEYVEGVWPATVSIPATNVVRTKIVDAGEAYRKWYIAPGTVVAVKEDGTLLRSTGGWVPKVSDTDPESHLEALAKLGFSYWGRSHKVLGLQTTRLKATTELDVGDLVTTIGNQSAAGGHRQQLDVVITSFHVQWPIGDPQSVEAPSMSFETDFGEIDPIQAAGDRGRRMAETVPDVALQLKARGISGEIA